MIFMARHWEGCEWIRTGIGSRGLAGHVCWFLGAVFAVLGIIGDAANATLGLEPMAWSSNTTEAKSKKKE